MREAKPLVDSLAVVAAGSLPDGVFVFSTPCEDAEGFVDLPPACVFDGRVYGRSGWSSDLGCAYYRTDKAVARGLR